MKKLFSTLMLGLSLSSVVAHAQIPVLSIDDLGQETVAMISDSDYQNITSVEADAFSQIAEDQVALASMAPHLTLKGILVGLEAQGTIGLGVFKLGTAINQQFYFEIK